MTDRINGLFVALDKDYRDDDVEVIINAIQMIKGVSSVKGNIVDAKDYFNRDRMRSELRIKLFKAIDDTFKSTEE